MKRYLIWLVALTMLAGGVNATTETKYVDYRLFLDADSIWVVNAVDGAKQSDSVKYTLLNTIDTTFTIADDAYEDFWFIAFGGGYGDSGSVTHYFYDNHNTGDTSAGTLALAADMAKALDSLAKIIDSLEAQDNWIAHQTTADSGYAIADSILDTLLLVQDSTQAYDGWIAHQTTIDSTLTGYASMVPSDTNINGDTIATQGTDQTFRLRSLTVTNTTGNAVTFTGGLGGGEPIVGHGLSLASNYGDGLRAVSAASGYDINADIYGGLTGNITGNLTGNITGNLSGDIGGSITGDLDGDVTSIANAVITTSAFAAGALNSNVFATDAFTASKFHSDLTGAGGEIRYGVWTASIRSLSMGVSLLTGEYTEIADSVWGVENQSYGRQLTHFDEDYTTLDINATTIGTVIGVTNDVNLADADMGAVADSTWNKAFATAFTGGSMGDSLNNSSYVQGSASLTAAEIMDSLFKRLVSDTVTGTFFSELFRNAQIGGDSASWADITDVWRNQDTTHVDTSDLGAWIENNSGAAAASNWADAQRDSVLAVIADAGKIGLMLDSIFAIIDTVQNQDDWIAAATNLTLVIDTVNGLIDTVQLYDTRFDSLLAALSDAAIGDKVWIDPGARTLSSYIWNTTQRDSVLNTIEDANKANFMADISTLSTFDEATDSVIVDVSSAGAAGGLASVIEDTIHAHVADYKATGFSSHSAGDVADAVWNEDTTAHYTAGKYGYEATQEATGFSTFDPSTDSVIVDVSSAGSSGGLAATMEDSVHAQAADYKADVSGLSTFDPSSDSVIVDVSSAGAAAGLASAIEDTINAQAADYKADVSGVSTFDESTDSVIVDVSAANTAGGLVDKTADGVWDEDSTGHYTAGQMAYEASQTTATALTEAGIADAVWNEDSTGHYTPGQMAYEASQTAATALTEAGIADAVWNEDTTGHYTAGKYGYETAQEADISGLSTFDESSDSVIVDVSAAVTGGGLADGIADNVWDEDTTGHYTAGRYGYEALQGAGSDTVAILAMMNAEDFAKNTDSLLLKNRAQIANESADSTKNDSTAYHGAGSDTVAVLAMMNAEDFAKNTDSLLLANRAEISAQIEDSVHGNAADYKATGYSTLSKGDVADTTYKKFTADANEDAFKATGFLAITDSVLLANRAEIAGQIEDSVHANAVDYMSSGWPTALDVYNTFIAGTNENAFWINRDSVADAVWDEDSTGHYTAGLMAFEASKTAATALTEGGIADAVWDEVQSGHTTSGTFGANLDVAVSSIAGLAGSGAYTQLIQVLDTGATVDSAVTNGKVYVNNVAQNLSGGPYQADLNNNGVAAFQLDNGTWVMFITYPGFAPKLDTFTVSTAATDTLMVYRDAGALTTVSWQLDKPNGLPYANARVSINLVQMYPDDSILYVADTSLPAILSRELVATADANGLMSINLYPNDNLGGDSSWYEIFARASSGNNPITRKFKYRIPTADTTVSIQDLTRWRD